MRWEMRGGFQMLRDFLARRWTWLALILMTMPVFQFGGCDVILYFLGLGGQPSCGCNTG